MKNVLLLLLVSSFMLVAGQNKKIIASPILTINIDADQFLGYDSFGFYYTIKNDVFSKTNDQQTLEYKNISLGKITKVDLQNPLKIALFYENFNTVVLLDNQLNETQKINFSENTTPILVTATGIAAQNQLWIYNSLTNQIGLYDYLKKEYRSISTSFPKNSKYYQSDFNSFYWIDQENNWYSCDLFGKTTAKGKIPDFDLITITNKNQFIVSKNNILIYQEIEKGQKFEIQVLEKTFKNFCYKDQILSIFTSKGITNYKIIIP